MKKFRLLFLIIAAMLAGTQAGVAKDDWTGATPTALKNAAGNNINTQSEEANFFLYNVGTGKFLTIGGQWGTQAVLKDVGLLLTMDDSHNGTTRNGLDVAYSIHTKYSVFSTAENYIQLMDGTDYTSVHDKGLWYTDRTTAQVETNNASRDLATFYFHSVGDNKYNIYIRSNRSFSGSPYNNQRVYLVAPENATNNSSVGIAVTGYNSQYSTSDPNAQWMLLSMSEVRDNFKSETANASGATPADGSYIIRCQNFSRNNGDLSQWRVGPVDDNHRLTTDYSSTIFNGKTNRMLAPGETIKYNDQSETTTNIYVGNGYALNDNSSDGYYDNTTTPMNGDKKESHQKLYGGYWTANIQGPGTIWQQIYVPITTAGWYIITCDGFTTANAGRVYLFAATTTTKIPDNGAVNVDYIDYALGDFNPISKAPATYTAAGQMLMNQDGYQKNAMIYINPEDPKYGKAPVYLIMGVQATGEKGTAGEKNPVNSDAWTCIDNFEIKYAGSQKEYIVLDENQEDVTYINNQVSTTNSYPMRLGRTLDKDKWNSLILPVSLTAHQVKFAFGDNARLSKKSSNPQKNDYVIEFESVKLNVADETIVLEAGTPYIIKPSIDPQEAAGKYKTRGTNPKEISLGAHYLIYQVTLAEEVSAQATGNNGDAYDCGMAGDILFKGTYVKASNLIPDGSYLLSKGQWYHMTLNGGNVASVKGFRTWLEPVSGTATSNENIQFSIDGVIDGDTTNSIEGIENGFNSKADNKVYNMNGQLVRNGSTSLEGLPKGVYIVNNKKYIVK